MTLLLPPTLPEPVNAEDYFPVLARERVAATPTGPRSSSQVRRAALPVIKPSQGTEWMDKAPCKDHHEIFLPADPRDRDALLAARKICWRCPLFEKCWDWVSHQPFEEVQVGIYAGISEIQRNKIDCGLDKFRDWRKDFNLSTHAKKKYRHNVHVETYSSDREIVAARRAKRLAIRIAAKPVCPKCQTKEKVMRNGFDKSGRQVILCGNCGKRSAISEEVMS